MEVYSYALSPVFHTTFFQDHEKLPYLMLPSVLTLIIDVSKFSFGIDQIIRFDQVILNDGEGYNTGTGKADMTDYSQVRKEQVLSKTALINPLNIYQRCVISKISYLN